MQKLLIESFSNEFVFFFSLQKCLRKQEHFSAMWTGMVCWWRDIQYLYKNWVQEKCWICNEIPNFKNIFFAFRDIGNKEHAPICGHLNGILVCRWIWCLSQLSLNKSLFLEFVSFRVLGKSSHFNSSHPILLHFWAVQTISFQKFFVFCFRFSSILFLEKRKCWIIWT